MVRITRLHGVRTAFACILVVGLATNFCAARCPHLHSLRATLPQNHPPVPGSAFARHRALSTKDKKFLSNERAETYEAFVDAANKIDFDAVAKDLTKMMTTSQAFWPADYGHYGPLIIRLAWHCAGSYRLSDGRGGCDGGRIRFDPERSWDDNTNLDKALRLLRPIKAKYGVGLSWGDLIILAGNTAIKSMGGPVLGFCAGRYDDADGSESALLGPTQVQEKAFPCADDGDCKEPLGATTVGLIYVNPTGPKGNPVPALSAPQVRDTFKRMGMDDRETVALVGGGHAFGKMHGACPNGAGARPSEDPSNPWPGLCGTGKGADTATSGMEGPWTSTPTSWSNSYFTNLVGYEWEKFTSSGGAPQWRVKNGTANRPQAPSAHDSKKKVDIVMTTADVSLSVDDKYLAISKEFAKTAGALDEAFSKAWYKLTTRDMGPVTRCLGKNVPPAQPFQYQLPKPPAVVADPQTVAAWIRDNVLHKEVEGVTADKIDGKASNNALLVRLALACAGTYRQTDYRGGCDGARIRLSPEKDWASNKGLNQALSLLQPAKVHFGAKLSWADLIVIAGSAAVSDSGASEITLTAGRTDATDGSGSADLEPAKLKTGADLKRGMLTMGLSLQEGTALMAAGHLGVRRVSRDGCTGAATAKPGKLTGEFFRNLLKEKWEAYTATGVVGAKPQFKAAGKELYVLSKDVLLLQDATLKKIATHFSTNEAALQSAFASGWEKLMDAGRHHAAAKSVATSISSAVNAHLGAPIMLTIMMALVTLFW